MFCSCCLTTLEVKYSKMYDANLCPKCEEIVDEATDAIHEHDIESGDHADLDEEAIDDSDVFDEDWDELGDWEDDLVFDESDEEALEAIYDALENAEYEGVYAEDHDYGN